MRVGMLPMMQMIAQQPTKGVQTQKPASTQHLPAPTGDAAATGRQHRAAAMRVEGEVGLSIVLRLTLGPLRMPTLGPQREEHVDRELQALQGLLIAAAVIVLTFEHGAP